MIVSAWTHLVEEKATSVVTKEHYSDYPCQQDGAENKFVPNVTDGATIYRTHWSATSYREFVWAVHDGIETFERTLCARVGKELANTKA